VSKPRMNEKERDLMLRAMITMAAADGDLADVETATISAIFEKVSGEGVEPSEIEAAANGIAGDATALAVDLSAAAGELETNVKEGIVRAAYLVLRADGVVAAQERKKLLEIATALKLPEIHVSVILEELEE
jgi:tellurite resistance protein